MQQYSKRLRSLGMACAFLSFGLAANAAPPGGVPGSVSFSKAAEFSSRPFDRETALRERAEIHDWLVSEAVTQGLGRPMTVRFSPAERDAIDHGPRGQAPEKVGLTRALSARVDFSGLRARRLAGRSITHGPGAIAGTRDGGFVYTTSVSSPGATALRLHFTGFRLPPQTGLFLYSENGQVFGPYTGRGPLNDGEFWSHTVMGDHVIVQLRHVGQATDDVLRGTGFTLAGLGHLRPRFLGHCSNNESCVEGADCPGVSSVVNDAKNAVAHMQWPSGPYIYICSGGLLADTDPGSVVPLFLSANHCISRGKDARNLENFFQLYSDSNCGSSPSCDDVFDHQANHPQQLRTLGASILSTGRNADYTLFQLNQAAPSGSAYLGWNSSPIAFTDAAALYRISHPNGSPQAYSEHVVDTDAGTCSGWPRGDRIYSRDTFGATEGGSSGSPVLNAAGEVVGQLSGACGTDVNNTCNAVDNATVDGALAAYFSSVSQWLDPGPGCTPSTEICDDGADNDCDGLIDGDDPDCGGSGGFPPGSACLANSDCASNKCTGKPGSKTCK